jgi:hypothetical protein
MAGMKWCSLPGCVSALLEEEEGEGEAPRPV